jgi:hypothetical protein
VGNFGGGEVLVLLVLMAVALSSVAVVALVLLAIRPRKEIIVVHHREGAPIPPPEGPGQPL